MRRVAESVFHTPYCSNAMMNPDTIDASNREYEEADEAWRSDYAHLDEQLRRRGLDTDAVVEQVAAFEVAVPSWALGTGGTRFGRFPGRGEPRDIFEKMQDVSVVRRLTGAASRISLHIPWDEPDDPEALREQAAALGVGFDAVNSNTFQDQAGQASSYKFGSFRHTDAAVRKQAVAHNVHVVEVGAALGSKALTIWLGDGANYPGQMHLRKAWERVRDCLADVYEAMPSDWNLFIEHKPFEPAFYATVVADWGSSLMLARETGERASCLVDLGHHLPNVNVEQVVARLITAGRLGGFHFNDAKYGDDDLTAGSIKPYQLFLVFNELADALADGALPAYPSCMIDQSHNVKDPIEALLQTVDRLQKSWARALIVRRDALAHYQETNDVLMAEETLREAYETDVSALAAAARKRLGGAIDPIAAFRASQYREQVSEARTGAAYVPPQSL